MKVVSTEALTKLIQLVKSAFIKVDDVVEVTEIETETPSEITLASVATSGSYNDLSNKPNLSTKADTDLSNINASGKSFISDLAMPSSRYIDLTLGASGSSYTAPANGWFFVQKTTGSSVGYILLRNTSNGMVGICLSPASYFGADAYLPCKKGDVIVCDYDMTGVTSIFRFIYAEGENS